MSAIYSPSSPVVASKSTKADQLLGKTPEEKALVDQWLSFATSEIQTNVSYVNRLMNSVIPYNKPVRGYPDGQSLWLILLCSFIPTSPTTTFVPSLS
jgi:hypothetical protein